MPHITLLGTGTCQLQTHRSASSILVQLPELLFVFDFGRGTTQKLAQLNIKQNELQHIVLSHYHADHTSDLIPLIQASIWSQIDPRTQDLHIYGPEGLQQEIEKLVSIFGGFEEIDKLAKFKIHLHEIKSDQFTINNYSFISKHLPPVNNRGLKFTFNDKTYAFTGDSDLHDAEIGFLKDVDLAIIDAGHPSDDEIVQISVAAQPHKLILSHLYRETNEEEMKQKASKAGYKGEMVVGQDLMSFDI